MRKKLWEGFYGGGRRSGRKRGGGCRTTILWGRFLRRGEGVGKKREGRVEQMMKFCSEAVGQRHGEKGRQKE